MIEGMIEDRMILGLRNLRYDEPRHGYSENKVDALRRVEVQSREFRKVP